MKQNEMMNKLANLESVFIGDQDDDVEPGSKEERISQEYTHSVLKTENVDLKE